MKRRANNCITVQERSNFYLGGTILGRIGRGRAEVLDDVQEKIKGLALLMKNQTGQEFTINEQMASTVDVIKVVVDEFAAKARRKVL